MCPRFTIMPVTSCIVIIFNPSKIETMVTHCWDITSSLHYKFCKFTQSYTTDSCLLICGLYTNQSNAYYVLVRLLSGYNIANVNSLSHFLYTKCLQHTESIERILH